MKTQSQNVLWKLFAVCYVLLFLYSKTAGQDVKSERNTKLSKQPAVETKISEPGMDLSEQKEEFKVIEITDEDLSDRDAAKNPDLISESRARDAKYQNQVIPSSVNTDQELNVPVKETISGNSADKGSGTIYMSDYSTHTVLNESSYICTLSPDVTIPPNAVITDFRYSVRIDDNGNESTFYPADYRVLLSSESIDPVWLVVYDQKGVGHLDGNFDDDVDNDTDIWLYLRSTTYFNGDDADQEYKLRVWDYNPLSSEGIVTQVNIEIDWVSTDPNLSANFTPSGWDAPMIISHSTGSHSNSANIYAGVPVYITPTFANYTIDIPSSQNFWFDLLVDGWIEKTWNRSGALASYYYYFADQEVTFAAGSYEICQEVDPLDQVYESNEGDNEYCVTLTVYGPPSAPGLVAPANGATCQSTSTECDWNSVSPIYSYQLQVDNNADFSSPVYDHDGIMSSQMIPTGLSSNTTYHWRVRGINPAGNGAWSAVRSFTTAPASAPPAPDLTAPANGATCQPTTIILDGVSVPDAETYKLQVDDNADFSSPVVNLTGIHSNEQEVSGLSHGTTYHWRYASVNACGMSSAWSAAWEFTTGAIPSSPTLSGPSDGATCQPASLTLSWSSVSGAISYDVLVDDNDDFSSPVEDIHDISGTSTAISGLSTGTTYYWCVRSENSCGINSAWSAARDLTTAPPSPGIPAASAPADGSACQPLTLTLSWSAASHAAGYSLQVDDNSDFSSPLVNESGIGSTSHEVSSLSEFTNYHWRIKAENSCGTEGSWSSENSFTTLLTSIDAPVLSGPANAAECQPTSPTLSWNSVTNASSYDIEVDDNDDFSSPEFTGSASGTSLNCSELAENTIYYWRVMASGACSVTGSWSETRSFETGANGMAVPDLVDPVDNSTDQAVSLTLEWDAVTDAVSYQFQLDDADDFNSPLYDEIVTGTSHEVSGLEEGTMHFWQVRANGTCATGDWSDIWQFETAGSAPDAITDIKDEGYYLGQNYPNPFMESTTIVFRLPVDSKVNVEFLDMQGKLVETVSGYYTAGEHSLEIQLKGKVQSGIYLYRMKTLHFTDTRLCIVR